MSVRSLALYLLAFLFCVYASVHQVNGYNDNSRLDLLHALVLQGRMQIDDYAGNTGDKATYLDHSYSDKAPATAFLALPAFVIGNEVRVLLHQPVDGEGWRLVSWITAAGSVGLLAALGTMCLFLLFARWMEKRWAIVAALGIGIGSLPFAYATMLMSHAGVFGLLSIALWALLDDPNEHFSVAAPAKPQLAHGRLAAFLRRRATREIIAGLCCGLAIASEYTAAIGAGAVLVLAIGRGWKSGLRVALAAVPPLLLIPLYSWLCFGTPMGLPYSHNDTFDGMKRGFFGISLTPDTHALTDLLVSQYRGLFFWSPFLLLAFAGYPVLWKRNRLLCWCCILAPLLSLLLISTYPYWHGGFALGARHLVASIPFLALPAAVGLRRFRRVGTVITLWSMALVSFATILDAMPPEGERATLTHHMVERFMTNDLASNILRTIGLPPTPTLPLLMLAIAFFSYDLWLGATRESRRKKPVMPKPAIDPHAHPLAHA
jgi:hypothetical protein